MDPSPRAERSPAGEVNEFSRFAEQALREKDSLT
jgi:hypothetical protein